MAEDSFIAARVSHEVKAGLRALALEKQQTESAVIKSLLDSLMGRPREAQALKVAEPAIARGTRLNIRLAPEDRRLLRERAAARNLAPATYLAMLTRAHLRELSPLPGAELGALKEVIAKLSALERHVAAVVRIVTQSGNFPDSPEKYFLATLKICEALRSHEKELIKANARSWRTGNGQPNA